MNEKRKGQKMNDDLHELVDWQIATAGRYLRIERHGFTGSLWYVEVGFYGAKFDRCFSGIGLEAALRKALDAVQNGGIE